VKASGYAVDSDGSVTVTGPLSPEYDIDVVIKGVADDVMNNEIYAQDIITNVDASQDLTVTLDPNTVGKYSAVVEEDMGNTQVGAEFNLKDIAKTPDQINTYDNLFSNNPDQEEVSDTSVASETLTIIIKNLGDDFDVVGATLVSGTGTSRIWATTAADIDAGNVKITASRYRCQ